MRQQLRERISALPFYLLIRDAAGDVDCHVVGGALRDLAFGIEPTDVDLTLAREGGAIAKSLARSLCGRRVDLGGERFASYRIVAAAGTIDIWDRKGASLEDDLRRRDFTMHSFAVDLSTTHFVDPVGGLEDLHRRRLVATSRTSFSSDPLRILRLCRLASQIEGLQVAASTMELAFDARLGIHRVATERIDHELNRLLSCTDVLPGVKAMIGSGIYPRVLLSEMSVGATDARSSDRDLFRMLEFADYLASRLPQPVDPIVMRLAVLILASSRHAPSAPIEIDGDAHYQVPISRTRRGLLRRLLQCGNLPTDRRDQRWFIHRAGQWWPTALCIAAVRHSTSNSRRATLRLTQQLSDLAARYRDELLSPRFLVSGDDLLEALPGLGPGEELGRILDQVHRRQVEGDLTTRTEALSLARHLAARAMDGD